MAMMREWSLRRRMLLLGVLPALFMLLLLLGYLLQTRLSDADRELVDSGQLMARQLAASADYAVISGNVESLSGQVDALLQQPGVVRVRIFGSDDGMLLEKLSSRFHPAQSMRRFTSSIESVALGASVEDWLAPLENSAPRVLGRVEISFSNELALAREREILFTGLVLGALALAATVMLANAVAAHVRRPLDAVVAMVEKLEARDFTVQVDVEAGGELGKLGAHLNTLANTLEDARSMQARYTQDLVSARAQADRANRAKSEFLAMMSHELRTPLNGVSGMLQLLESTPLDAEQQEYVFHAEQAGGDLLRMVDDILDFSRMEQGKLHFE
jgi:signal transduction histidine kinase